MVSNVKCVRACVKCVRACVREGGREAGSTDGRTSVCYEDGENIVVSVDTILRVFL